MALLTYNFAALKAAAKHALGNAEPGGGLSLGEIVNLALQRLAEEYPWSFLRRPLSLDLTAPQNYIPLPPDFAAIDTIYSASGNGIAAVSLDTLALLRGNLSTDILLAHWHYALSSRPQASAAALPTDVMEIWPTPTASASGAFVGTYRRILPALSNDADLPDLPARFHPLLRAAVRAYALLEEEGQAGAEWESYQKELRNAVVLDESSQGSLGVLPSALGSRHGSFHNFTIERPS